MASTGVIGDVCRIYVTFAGFMSGDEATARANSSITFDNRFYEERLSSKTKGYEQEAQKKKLLGALQDIKLNLRSEETYLDQLEGWLQQNNPSITTTLIESVAMKVAGLYEEKERLEYELGEYEDKEA